MRLRDHPIFANLDAGLLQHVEAQARLMELPAGQQVFRPGDSCQGLPMVLKGSVRVQMTGSSGHEIVLYRIGDDDVCTLSIGCLMAGRGYRAEAIVEVPTTVVVLPYGLFDELMANSSPFRRQIMTAYGERLDTLMMLVEEIAFQRMDVRLTEWLRAHAKSSPLSMTHQDLAVELGTAREVVSRLLKDFEREGWIRLARGRIEILGDGPVRAAV